MEIEKIIMWGFVVLILILLTLFIVFEIIPGYINELKQQENCISRNFTYAIAIDDHFNCCKTIIVEEDNKYIQKEVCEKGD